MGRQFPGLPTREDLYTDTPLWNVGLFECNPKNYVPRATYWFFYLIFRADEARSSKSNCVVRWYQARGFLRPSITSAAHRPR